MRRKLFAGLFVITLLLITWAPMSGVARPAAAPAAQTNGLIPIVAYASRTDASAPLRQIPPMPVTVGELRELPRKELPGREGSIGSAGPDPVVQLPGGVQGAPKAGTGFEGIDNVDGVLPPDTNGDVGPDHYVQIVNLSFGIWTRHGRLLYGPANTNTLFTGFGGPCETTNDGDPIVQYDHLADRWLISQFALPRFPFGPFYQCIAVSQTGDPLGAYYRYEFTISKTKLNDYPKFGVWPDAYYMSVNQYIQGGFAWGGQGAVAFERDKMLSGHAARMVYFDLLSFERRLGGMLPADLDGPPPPTGTPNTFVEVDDDAWGWAADMLQIFEFHVDWSNPANSTFTRSQPYLATAPFDSNLCNYSRNCIPQPGGVDLDAISDRLMYRLQYRNLGTHEALVTNHTVDVNGADRAGARWYELRRSGGNWSIYQQGTYAPATDAEHRWMGSVAMNGKGELALGYSVSSLTVEPSIRVTGRTAADPLGQMPQAELEIRTGSGYQQHPRGRWGDYSMMAVDPVDDCTFWYTQEYYEIVGRAPWQTFVSALQVGKCGP